MHHAEILIGHFREMVGNWPLVSCYFALCTVHLMSDTVDQDPVCSKSDLFVFFAAILPNLAFCTLRVSLPIFLVTKITIWIHRMHVAMQAYM